MRKFKIQSNRKTRWYHCYDITMPQYILGYIFIILNRKHISYNEEKFRNERNESLSIINSYIVFLNYKIIEFYLINRINNAIFF